MSSSIISDMSPANDLGGNAAFGCEPGTVISAEISMILIMMMKVLMEWSGPESPDIKTSSAKYEIEKGADSCARI